LDERVDPELLVFPDIHGAASALAARIATSAREALASRGGFSLVIPGGSTPRWLFDELRGEYGHRLDWTHVDLFWSDERCVPPEDPRSNYRLAAEHLLPLPGLAPARIHRIRGELPAPGDAAANYEVELHRFWAGRSGRADEAQFDYAVLGIGPDGHTASLFPGSPTLEVTDRDVAVEPSPTREPLVPRVTMSLGALCRSNEVAFLAEGSEKSPVIAQSFDSHVGGSPSPASRVRGRNATRWYVDRAAGARVQRR
jgi:6-phosphogluconolactonase